MILDTHVVFSLTILIPEGGVRRHSMMILGRMIVDLGAAVMAWNWG